MSKDKKYKGTLLKGEKMKITEITPVMRKKSDKIRLAPYCRVSSDDEYTTGRKTNSKFVK